MLGHQCKYDENFECFVVGECTFRDIMACLKLYTKIHLHKIWSLSKRMMKKHTIASEQWRNKAFYYKSRNKMLAKKIRELKRELKHERD